MNIPQLLSKSVIRNLPVPKDSHIVRVILHDANNPGPYRLHCRTRTYIFEVDGTVGKHVLDFPISLWMEGSSERYRENKSIADDFRSATFGKFTILVIASEQSKQFQSTADQALPVLRNILSKLGAPDAVVEAFQMIEKGDIGGLHRLEAGIQAGGAEPDQEPEAEEETPAQARARKMREAKAAKRNRELQSV